METTVSTCVTAYTGEGFAEWVEYADTVRRPSRFNLLLTHLNALPVCLAGQQHHHQ